MFQRLFLLIALLAIAPFAQARDVKEDARINFLIEQIANLNGSVFVRNGSDHSSEEAVKHLRMKLGKGGERIKTAEDFIEGVASKSSFTGQKYKIRSKDGTEVDASEFLRKKLAEKDAAGK